MYIFFARIFTYVGVREFTLQSNLFIIATCAEFPNILSQTELIVFRPAPFQGSL